MRRYHPVFPYENENREELKAMAFQPFDPARITLFCKTLCVGIEENRLVSRGQCVGFIDERPVYSGIDGRVAKISTDMSGVSVKKYKIRILKEVHREKGWCEIPFFKNSGGDYFLRQLGLVPPEGIIREKDVLWVDGIESEPFSASCYRLLVEETAKVVLGAGVLGRCYGVKKVNFCVDKQWTEVYYLLEKYLKKYADVLDQGLQFEICGYTRCCPAPYLMPGRLIFYPQMLIHAYNGYYEKMPAVSAYVTVAGHVMRCANFIIPAGTHVGDIISACGIDGKKSYRFVVDGVMTGRSVPVEYEVIMPENTSLCVVENVTAVEMPCIGCRACAAVCPVHLKPYKLDENTFNSCIQCGCCSYVCPSHIRLSEKIKHRAKGDTSKRRFDRKKHGSYVEIAPEFAGFIEPLNELSDAPPHIHRISKISPGKMKALVLMIPLYGWAASAYGWLILFYGFIGSLLALLMTELAIRTGMVKKAVDSYVSVMITVLVLALSLPVGISVPVIIFADIMACILGLYNL